MYWLCERRHSYLPDISYYLFHNNVHSSYTLKGTVQRKLIGGQKWYQLMAYDIPLFR
jgi:hypothetical protein